MQFKPTIPFPDEIQDTVEQTLRTQVQNTVAGKITDAISTPGFQRLDWPQNAIIYAYAFWVFCLKTMSAVDFEAKRLKKRLDHARHSNREKICLSDFPPAALQVINSLSNEDKADRHKVFQALEGCPELQGKSALDWFIEKRKLNIPSEVAQQLVDWKLLDNVSVAIAHKPVVLVNKLVTTLFGSPTAARAGKVDDYLVALSSKRTPVSDENNSGRKQVIKILRMREAEPTLTQTRPREPEDIKIVQRFRFKPY
jgi:hypothetical protein